MLTIDTKPGETCVVEFPEDAASAPDSQFAKLLGLILAQAWSDGMHRVELGADPAAGETYLRYTRTSPDGADESWDMTPVPAQAYSRIVQTLVDSSVFGSGCEAQGRLDLALRGKAIRVGVDVRSWHDVRLTFAERR